MNVIKTFVGKTSGHSLQGPSKVHQYTLCNDRDFTVTVWTYGATMIEVLVPDWRGNRENVILRLPNLRNYEDRSKNAYFGATLGRYARCIANGRFSLDGKEYQLDCNFGNHHFHGGPIGFDRFVWDAYAKQNYDRVSLHLRLERPDGDQGYPGAVAIETCYTVHQEGRLTIDFRATTSAKTVMALTNHSFWNLNGSRCINEHFLAINAQRVLKTNEELIPIGISNVYNTELNYLKPKLLGEYKLDHCFILDNPLWAATYQDPFSRRVMKVFTDQPGLAVYSADSLAKPRGGLCLQTGAWPDSPNHLEFPSSQLDQGMEYQHHVTYDFSLLNNITT